MDQIDFRCLTLFLSAVSAIEGAVKLANVKCDKPLPTTVAVDFPQHRYYPYFVRLHRCQGSVNHKSPNNVECVPTAYIERKVEVFSTKTWKRSEVIVRNHTSCTSVCKANPMECRDQVQQWNQETCSCECLYRDPQQKRDGFRNHTKCEPACVRTPDECDPTLEDWVEDQCACNCKYQNGPPKELACKENERWNKNTCKCECAKAPDICPVRMTWSNEICGCRCLDSVVNVCTGAKMGIDVNCNCVTVLPSTGASKGAKSQTHLFLALLTGQAVIILVLICALVHWVRKRCRQNSDHSSVDKLNSNKSDEEIYHHYSQIDLESGSTDSLKDSKCTSYDDVRRTDPSSPPSPV